MKANKISLFFSALILTSILFLQDANAAGGGGTSLGLGFSTVGASQNDLNGAIDDAVTAGANTKNLGSAYDFYANWSYRFAGGMYAIVIRPSYFTQTTSGSGTGGSYDYGLTGFTVFPIFRIYPLENAFIKFFMQAGLGYGSLNGSITAGTKNLEFSGSAFGAVGGVGVQFCFTPTHCMNIEGNLRYMPIARNISTGGSCSASGDIPGLTQCGGGREVERANNDLQTTMSGVQGLLGYEFNF